MKARGFTSEVLRKLDAALKSAFDIRFAFNRWTIGEDFLTVIEAPDNETVAHLSVDLGSRGTVKVTTLPALDIASFVEKLKGPKQMGHG